MHTAKILISWAFPAGKKIIAAEYLLFFILTENNDLITEYQYRHEGVNDYFVPPPNIPYTPPKAECRYKYPEQPLSELQVDDLYFCLEQRLATVRGQEIGLTVKEFAILALLIMNPKRVFTYEMLMDLVWNEDYSYYSRKAVNNQVRNLRRTGIETERIWKKKGKSPYIISKNERRAIVDKSAYFLR